MPSFIPSCGICTEDLDVPISLPCGHLFCKDCIERALAAVMPLSTLHSCPVCRTLYITGSVDSASIPAHLRGHVHPSVRRLYPNTSTLEPRIVTAPAEIAIENRRLHAENCALKTTCSMWRRRAEAHAAATLGLLELARSTRDQAENMRRERDEVCKHYDLLRENIPETDFCTCDMKSPPLPQTIVEAASHDTYNRSI